MVFLWKLEAGPYGLVNSGRLFYLTSTEAVTTSHGLK